MFGHKSFQLAIDVGTSKTRVYYYENGVAKILRNKNHERFYEPWDYASGTISSYPKVLEKIKKEASSVLGTTIDSAVFAVPAIFNIKQSSILMKFANEAFFTVTRLEDAFVAAAFLFHNEMKITSDCFSLVLDFGIHCKVAVVKQETNMIKVITSATINDLASCFNRAIYDYICKSVLHTISPTIQRSLLLKCESAKKALSASNQTSITVDEFPDDLYEIAISKNKFNQLCADLFEDILHLVDGCVKKAEIPKRLVEHIILAGGTSRIPKIRELLEIYFNKKDTVKFINPEECVAEGVLLLHSFSNTRT